MTVRALSIAALLLTQQLAAQTTAPRPVRFAEQQRWGYVAPDGSVAIAPRFIGAGAFRNNVAPVQDDQGFALIDAAGREIERFSPDTVAPSAEAAPAPKGRCVDLRCYVLQLQGTRRVLGGAIRRSGTSRGEPISSAVLRKLPYGAVLMGDSLPEGHTLRLLLPGVTADTASAWVTIIWPEEPKRTDKCEHALTSGSVVGGAYLELRQRCE